MGIEAPRLSPGKGRWPKSAKKRAIRERNLKSAGAYKQAIKTERGFHASQGAASKGTHLDPNSPEFAAIAEKYKTET